MFWHDKGQGYGASLCFGMIKVKVMVLHCVSAG